MKNILLPTDFSENSINAIDYAVKLFSNSEIKFHILNVQIISDYTTSELMTSSPSNSVYKEVLDDNKLKIEKLVEKLEAENSSQKFTFKKLLDYDVCTDAIRQAVKLYEIDLIIMGTNGATGAKEVIFGSNTIKVIRNINCPIIAVPEKFSFSKIKRILFSIHSPLKTSYSGLKPLRSILRIYEPDLDVLEITEDTKQLKKEEDDLFIKDILYEFDFNKFEIKKVPFLYAIEVFQQLMPVDLHALLIEKESFIDRIIFGSKTSNITYNSKVPLLVLHP
ncbi:MAG: nucleotide-binding universal stress UspA family protein [Sediminicola sp.]|jgi:nucleotide-binding universal stress UspA family protein